MKKLLSIAIISKDRPKQLDECLVSLQKNIPHDTPILIFDASACKINQKEVNSLTQKYENYSNLKIFSKEFKLGSQPIQRNLLLEMVQTEYVLFIDDDCYFSNDTFTKFYNFLNSNLDRHMLGCRIIQGSTVMEENKNLPNYDPIFWGSGSFNIDSNNIVEVDHLQGTFMCFKTKSLNSVKGFNESLAKGYAPFEETYSVLKLNKEFNKKALVNFSISVRHGVVPRLEGGSRDLGKDFRNAYAYGRNGFITSIMFFGFIKVILFLPLTVIIQSLRIIRPVLNDPASTIKRFFSVTCFIIGVFAGLFYSTRRKLI